MSRSPGSERSRAGRRFRGGRRSGTVAIQLALILIVVVEPLAPAVITIKAGCALAQAIRAANNDAVEGGCPAGSGADTIVLTGKVNLNAVEDTSNGNSGLPAISSEIRIDGRNHTISRDPGALFDFRHFYVAAAGNLTLDRVTLSGGRGAAGGSIQVRGGGMVTLTNTTVSDNQATGQGGGIYSFASQVRVYRSTFSSNESAGVFGGAIRSVTSIGGAPPVAELLVDESVLYSNEVGNGAASSSGGAIASYGAVTISNSTFTGNSADFGSAIQIGGLSPGAAVITNSTISGNNGLWGAVQGDFVVPASVTLDHVTVSGNYPHGLAYLDANINGSIIAYSPLDNCVGVTVSGANNLADDDSCPLIPDALTGFLPFLTDNGGLTQTHALVAGSSAIDTAGFCAVATDQRGAPRVGACDIGAFEYLGCPELELDNDVIAVAETYEECAISVGPKVSVVGPGGDLTLRTGTSATFSSGFSVENGASLTVEQDGSLQMILPELIEADRARRRARLLHE